MNAVPISYPSSSKTFLSFTQNIVINKQLVYIILFGHLINHVFATEHNSTNTDILYTNPKSNIKSNFENNIIDTSDDAVYEIKLNPNYDNNNMWLRNDKQIYKYVVETVDAEVNITITNNTIKEAVVSGNNIVNTNVNKTHDRLVPSVNITTLTPKVIHTQLHNITHNVIKNSTKPHVEKIQSDKNKNESLENIEKESAVSKNIRYDHNIKSNISFIDTKSESPVKERVEMSTVTDANIDTEVIVTMTNSSSNKTTVRAQAEDKAEIIENNLNGKKTYNNSSEVLVQVLSNDTAKIFDKIKPCCDNSTNSSSVSNEGMIAQKIKSDKTEVILAKEGERHAKVKSEKNLTKSSNDTDGSDSFTSITDFHEIDFDSSEEPLEDYDTGVLTEFTTKKAPTSDPFSAVLGFAGSVAGSVVEKVLPKWIIDVMKRMQKQNTQLETIRLRSREENGGIGQVGRNFLRGLSTGIYQPLNVWIQGVRDFGSLDSDKNFFSGVASGVVGVADGVVNMASGVLESFKDRVQAIYPGTLWCGDGHMAREQELGLFFFTDTCCRQHDECKLYIKSGETRFGLTNTGLFTRSHCSCDDSFRQCLKRTGSLVSSQIGLTFFNVLGPQCFKRAHPIVRCVRRTRITSLKCEQYELDYTKPKMWQWFDNETF